MNNYSLFANNLFNAAQNREAQGQPRVDTGRGAADIPTTDQELVARDLGVGRVLAKGTDKER